MYDFINKVKYLIKKYSLFCVCKNLIGYLIKKHFYFLALPPENRSIRENWFRSFVNSSTIWAGWPALEVESAFDWSEYGICMREKCDWNFMKMCLKLYIKMKEKWRMKLIRHVKRDSPFGLALNWRLKSSNLILILLIFPTFSDEIYIAPSGVQKERIAPDDLFITNMDGDDLQTPPEYKK
jgi:hypothetical protein